MRPSNLTLAVALALCTACTPAAEGPAVTPTSALAGRAVTAELVSSDGAWRATGYGYGPNEELPALEVLGPRAFSVSGIPEAYQADGASLAPVAFAPDASAVFFTLVPTLEAYFWYPYGAGLQRLDLATGAVSEVLAHDPAYVQALALSPDTTRLAYTRYRLYQDQSPVTVFIRDLAGGPEARYVMPAGYGQGGGIVWSPDQQSLLLGLARTSDSWAQGSVLVRVDLEQDSVHVLSNSSDNVYIPLSWETPKIVRVRDFGEQAEWELDPDSGLLQRSE
jgi:hypothetical protein